MFRLPSTKVFYKYLGVNEPEAWKYVVLSCIPMGFFLMPSAFMGHYETVVSLKDYSNWFNSVLGLIMFIGGLLVCSAWWMSKIEQGSRVLLEIRGNVLIFGAFATIILLGLPFFPNATFTMFASFGICLGALFRAVELIRNHYKFVKLGDEK